MHPEFSAESIRTIHQDEDLLILHKPSGLLTTSRKDGELSLATLAESIDPSARQLHASSRLDREVSGLVTFARNGRANRRLLEAREKGHYRRRYCGIAITSRALPKESWIDVAIGIDPNNPRRRVATNSDKRAKASKSQVHVLSTLSLAREQRATLLEMYPLTGRTHQLRVHADFAGAPLAGDTLYGGPRHLSLPNGRMVRAPRVMLACVGLDLFAGEEKVSCLDAPAQDFLNLWLELGGNLDELHPLRSSFEKPR